MFILWFVLSFRSMLFWLHKKLFAQNAIKSLFMFGYEFRTHLFFNIEQKKKKQQNLLFFFISNVRSCLWCLIVSILFFFKENKIYLFCTSSCIQCMYYIWNGERTKKRTEWREKLICVITIEWCAIHTASSLSFRFILFYLFFFLLYSIPCGIRDEALSIESLLKVNLMSWHAAEYRRML